MRFGVVALFSANGGFDGDISETKKQIIWFGVGLVIMAVIVFVDYEILGKLWIPLFGVTTVALVAVLFTEPVNRCNELV